jgi:uncharacterized membrane protein YcaP (DUF421 family)
METVAHILVVYLFVLLALRVIGKRELGEFSPFELIMLMLIPEIVSNAVQRDDYSLVDGLVGTATLFTLVWLTSVLTYKFQKAGEILEGRAVVLVSNGRFNLEMLDKERVSVDEILSGMHQAGIDKVSDLKWVILESDGNLSFIPSGTPEGKRKRTSSSEKAA